MRKLAALIVLLAGTGIASGALPGLTFHAPYDGTVGASPGPVSKSIHGQVSYVGAPSGQAVLLANGSYLSYPTAGCFSKSVGTLSLWIRPQWHGNDGRRYGIFSDTAPTHEPAYNSFYMFKTPSSTLQFSLGGTPEHSLNTTIADWTVGEWHHVAATWDCTRGMALYVDGALAGEKRNTYEPQQWPAFNVGADYDGSVTAEAAFSDVMIFDRMLRADQVAAIAQRMPLEVAGVIEMTAPKSIKAGDEFALQLRVLADEPLTRPHAILINLGEVPLLSVMPHPPAQTWRPGQPVELDPITVRTPDYVPLAPGQYPLTAFLAGTATRAATVPVEAPMRLRASAVSLGAPACELMNGTVYDRNVPWLPAGPAGGFLYEGKLYGSDDEGRVMAAALYEKGKIRDALRCRVVEELEIVGTPATSYILRNSFDATSGAPRPHILVVGMDGDISSSVGLEVLAAGNQQLEDRFLVWAALNPNQSRGPRPPESFLFYPQTEACEVRFTSLTGSPGRPPVPLRKLGVYELLDYPQQNVNQLPERPLRRSLALLPTHSELIYSGFGTSGKDLLQRQRSLRQLMEYMHFVGFDRLTLYVAGSNMQSFYDRSILPNAWRWDLLEDVLPFGTVAGVEIVPLLPPLSNFDGLFTFTDPDSFQMDINGQVIRDAAGRRCPDPLRREVQKQLLVFLDEFCAKTDGYNCVPAMGVTVDGATGTCFASIGPEQTADKVGYSAFDLKEFQTTTGMVVGLRADTPTAAYYWLRNSPEAWSQWLDFRCAETHDLWTKCRDLVVSRNPRRYLLVDANLPVPAAHASLSQLDLMRHHGYDPRLFAEEHGLRVSARIGPEAIQERASCATADGVELQIECTELGPGRGLLLPLLQAVISQNPYCLTLRSSLDAKAGHECALRGFARAFRALPAVAGQAFDGEIYPAREDIWVKMFSDCLAVVNLSDKAQEIRLTFGDSLPLNTQVVDVTTGQRMELLRRGRSKARLTVDTDAYELRTLRVIQPIARTGGDPMRPGGQ